MPPLLVIRWFVRHMLSRTAPKTWVIWLATVFAAGGELQAGGTARDLYAMETWQTDRGMPQNSVNALIQSHQGYLWIGTYNGLARFDGVRFVVFDSANTRAMRNGRITSLFEDAHTNLWIGHETGELTRLMGGVFQSISLSNRWPGGAVQNIAVDEHADLWLLSIGGSVLRLRDGLVLKPFPGIGLEPGGTPEMVKSPDGRLLVCRNGVAAVITNGQWQPIAFDNSASYYSRLIPANKGGFWVDCQKEIRQWTNAGWTSARMDLPAGISFQTTMMETRSGQLLVGTINHGLIVCSPSEPALSISTADGLPQNWVKCLLQDHEGNIWVGTRGGLSVLRPRKVVMQSPPDNWQNVLPLAICPGREGAVWAGSEGAGLYHFDGQGWQHFGEAEGLNLYVWSVLQDAEGMVWAGTWSGGLFCGRNGKFSVPEELSQLRNPVTALLEFPAGTLWIGTGNGLLRRQNGRLESLVSLGGAAAADIRALATGSNGELWIGSLGAGLGRLTGGKLQNFTERDGLPGDYVLSLHSDTEGTLWIGTLEQGLSRLKNGKFSTLDVRQGLPNNVIAGIVEDRHGNLWFNSSHGIFSASKTDLNRVADNLAQEQLNCLTYGTSEGLANLAGSAGFTPAGFRDANGRLWFPNSGGLAVVNPDQVNPNHQPPPVIVEAVYIGGKLLLPVSGAGQIKDGIQVPPGGQQIEIQFTALSFTAPEEVRFKWLLEGFNDRWSKPDSRRAVTFSYLPPGKYVFQLQACNNDGVWSSTATTLVIHVQPHFWETWWFKLGSTVSGLVVFGGSIVSIQRARTRRKLEHADREREIERERARIAQDIHDDLGASLTRIGMLSQTAGENPDDPDRTAHYLTQIYISACEMTRSMDEIVWAVNPQHDTLESLFNYLTRFAHEYLAPTPIRCRLQVPVEFTDRPVRSDIRHNLFLALKETLNNAVRHSGASEVELNIQLEGDDLCVVVTDNGQAGADASGVQLAGRIATGHGRANIESRLAKIGGHSEYICTPGQGVRVELRAPLAGRTKKTL